MKLILSAIFRVALITLLFSNTLTAQIFNPVKWSFYSHYKGDGEFELQFIAKIDGKWHLYGMDVPEGGPVPTSFTFKPNPSVYTLIGKTNEPEGIIVDDPVFQMRLKYFDTRASFTQRVKVKGKKAIVSGELEYMVCDDSKCLPPDFEDFHFHLTVPDKEPQKANPKPDTKEKETTKDNKTTPASKTTTETKTVSSEPTKTEEKTTETNTIKPVSNPGIIEAVAWETQAIALNESEYELQFIANVIPHWHIYSQFLPDGDGPIATKISITPQKGVELVGEPEERGKLITEYDPNFMTELSYFENKVVFVQKIKITDKISQVEASITHMLCDSIRCILPDDFVHTFALQETVVETPSTEAKDEGSRSLIAIFLLSFLGGFAALLTPCVFPMIPMTVSFFTKQSKTRAEGLRNAILYGLSIIFIYTILGFAITYIFGADALNRMATDPWFNMFFFVLLVVFAISFLGAFEITLPSSWVNKADRAADKGGLIGIFFMAVTLSLVSFSCTGPIIGSLLVDAAVHGGVSGPLVGMFGFSLALALPFGLFAAFPGWLNSLPKSGGWLNSVKVVLGFLELALAFKFLSNADLVLQAGIITREVFLALWIGIFGMLTLYLMGKIRMPHDSPSDSISVGRALFATLSLVFTIYLIPGLWGAPLKVISGFPPPMFYSESPQGVGYVGGNATVLSNAEAAPEGTDPAHCPHNLNCFHDYETGVAYAKKVGKPVMLDFTGWACVNCRKMEEQVWSDPRVLTRLQNDVVLISLYVDEKTRLSEEEQYVSEISGKKMRTIGNKWSDFQAAKYGTNSQPYYLFVDYEGNPIHDAAAYDPNIEKFIAWLDEGKKAYKLRYSK